MIALFLLFTFCIKAQLSISNLSLTDTSQNIFYIGVDNRIRISGERYSPLNQSLSITGGGATIAGLMGNYIIRVQNETDNCQIWIKENAKTVFKQSFFVRKVGDVVVRYGGLKDSTATVNQLLANPFLYIDIPGSYYKHNYLITSFSAIFIFRDLDSMQTLASGNLLTTEQIELIKKLIAGNKILFDQIYAVSPDGQRRKLKPFTLTIQ